MLALSNRSKKDKSKTGSKTDAAEAESEGLTLLVPDIQQTAEIVQLAATSLRQAVHGKPINCLLPSSVWQRFEI